MKYSNMKIISLCALLYYAAFFLGTPLLGKAIEVSSEDQYKDVIDDQEFTVVMFYEGGEEKSKKTKDLERMFKAVSADRADDLQFLIVDTMQPELQDLAEDLGVMDVPVFILFVDEQPMVDKDGNTIQLTGFVSQNQLADFIDAYVAPEAEEEEEYDEDDYDRRVRRRYYYPGGYYRPYGYHRFHRRGGFGRRGGRGGFHRRGGGFGRRGGRGGFHRRGGGFGRHGGRGGFHRRGGGFGRRGGRRGR